MADAADITKISEPPLPQVEWMHILTEPVVEMVVLLVLPLSDWDSMDTDTPLR